MTTVQAYASAIPIGREPPVISWSARESRVQEAAVAMELVFYSSALHTADVIKDLPVQIAHCRTVEPVIAAPLKDVALAESVRMATHFAFAKTHLLETSVNS